MKTGSLVLLNQEEKYKVINTFLKSLIDENIINIYREDNSIDDDLLFTIAMKTNLFNNIEFVKN